MADKVVRGFATFRSHVMSYRVCEVNTDSVRCRGRVACLTPHEVPDESCSYSLWDDGCKGLAVFNTIDDTHDKIACIEQLAVKCASVLASYNNSSR